MSVQTLILVLVAVAAAVGVGWALAFNALTRARLACDTAWSLVDVQLRRRHDLIPNLVRVVSGYAAHERALLQAAADARTTAVATPDLPRPETAAAERLLVRSTEQLLALAEQYPQLKADEHFRRLQLELADLENQIQASRQIYNQNVASYRTRCQSFPLSIVAGASGFEDRQMFTLEPAEATSIAPPVA